MNASLLKTLLLVVLTCCLPLSALYSAEKDAIYAGEPDPSQKILIPTLSGIVLNGDVCCMASSSPQFDKGITFNGLIESENMEILRENLETAFLNRPFTEQSVFELKQVIVDYYIKLGYPLVDVCIPPQDITDGLLQIGIIESKLGELRICGNRWFSDACFREVLCVEEDQPIYMPYLTSNLYWLNRNPFRSVDLVFSPGEEHGTTDIDVVVDEEFPFRVYGGTDTWGNEPIGRGRFFTGFTWGNAFGLGHILTYQFTASDHFNRLKAHAIEYEAPLPWQHTLYIYGGYAQLHLKHLQGLFDNEGHNFQLSVRYDLPLCDYNPCDQQGFDFGFDYKKTDNDLFFGEDVINTIFEKEVQVTQGVLEYYYETYRDWGSVYLDIDFVFSPFKWLKHQDDEDYESLRPFARARYAYIYGEAEAEYYLPRDWSFVTRVEAQFANQNLLPSEEIWIGGFDTVRGYEERVVGGDSGFIINFELWTPSFSPLRRYIKHEACANLCDCLEFLVFFDYGTVAEHKTFSDDEDDRHYLMSIGPGIRYSINDNFYLRADWGFQMHRAFEGDPLGHLVNVSAVFAF